MRDWLLATGPYISKLLLHSLLFETKFSKHAWQEAALSRLFAGISFRCMLCDLAGKVSWGLIISEEAFFVSAAKRSWTLLRAATADRS